MSQPRSLAEGTLRGRLLGFLRYIHRSSSGERSVASRFPGQVGRAESFTPSGLRFRYCSFPHGGWGRAVDNRETVRETFSCRDCEKISQAPTVPCRPHWTGLPEPFAIIMFEKFCQPSLPSRALCAGRPADALSTLAGAVGAVCASQNPLLRPLEAHVMGAEPLLKCSAIEQFVPSPSTTRSATFRLEARCVVPTCSSVHRHY
ncbi:hypothetical protein ABIB68_007506 [Bradyrhizobium sp. F1.2.2]